MSPYSDETGCLRFGTWDAAALGVGLAVTTAVAVVTISACLLALRGRVR